MIILNNDIINSKKRANNQWNIEEKVIFDKILKTKDDNIKKECYSYYEPKLKTIAEEGKIALRIREDELSLRCDKLKSSLNIDISKKIDIYKNDLSNKLHVDEERSRKICEKKLEDTLRQQSIELNTMKDNYIRDKRLLNEDCERSIRSNAGEYKYKYKYKYKHFIELGYC